MKLSDLKSISENLALNFPIHVFDFYFFSVARIRDQDENNYQRYGDG